MFAARFKVDLATRLVDGQHRLEAVVGVYAGYIIQTFVTLLAVCGLAFAVLVGARKLGIGRPRGPIELVGVLPIEARRSVYLVRIGAHVLVLGASEAGLTKLGELPAEALSNLGKGASFRDVLAGGGRKAGDVGVPAEAAPSDEDRGAA